MRNREDRLNSVVNYNFRIICSMCRLNMKENVDDLNLMINRLNCSRGKAFERANEKTFLR